MTRRGKNSTGTLREQALEQLRMALLSGDLKHDEIYSVPSLTDEFGFSATPIREAILDLAKEGLIVTVPNRGFRVVRDSPETIAQVAAVRKMLEVPATITAATSITDDGFADLMSVAVAIKKFAVKRDLPNFFRKDQIFHERIMEYTGNPLLVQLTESLRAKARLHALPTIVASGKLVESADEHIALLKAMQDGDNRSIQTIVCYHIDYAVRAHSESDSQAPSQMVTSS